MYILTVIPVQKAISKETLTYFTKKDVSVGSIVSIPLRKKTAYGLVIKCQNVIDTKSEIKSLSYNLRKIDEVETHTFFHQKFIEGISRIADYYAASSGAVLSTLIPNTILDAITELSHVQTETERTSFYETLLLQSDDEERYATYKSFIREEFAKGRSVFFCLPTIEDLKNATSTLEKGIESYTYTLHSGLSKKEIVATWKKVTENTHPVLIVSTGSFLSLPRNDIGTIILEKESSRAYKMQSRPFLDIRMVAEIIAKSMGRRLILGDTLLRIETLWEGKNGGYAELSPLKFRSLSTAQSEIKQMRGPENGTTKSFSIFSEDLLTLVKKGKENNEHTFLFCGRKGLYPLTLCADCGTTVVCNNCHAPVVLYSKKNQKGEKKNLFVCHHCGERRDADVLCKHCGGWRLNTLGIGIEKVEEELYKYIPDAHIVVMDKDHIPTHKAAVKARDSFYTTPGSIMLGTEMALTYLNQKIENTAVVSLDTFFSIPDFRIHEKIFHIVLALRALAEKQILIQTRQENTKIFDNALRGNLIDFYRDEIEERKQIGYPPFVTCIKLTIEGEKKTIQTQMNTIAENLKPYEMLVFDAFNPGSNKTYSIHGLITLKKGEWIDQRLLSKLRELPPYIAIKIDPDTLL